MRQLPSRYVPHVADSKRAMDEYTSEIFMGGTNTIVMHNTCEDSLLATPLIIDLAILADMVGRIQYKTGNMATWSNFHPVMSLLSYLIKAPLVSPPPPTHTPCNRHVTTTQPPRNRHTARHT